MRWGDFDLNWGGLLSLSCLSSIKKKLIFDFHHITSSNSTFIDKEFEKRKNISRL